MSKNYDEVSNQCAVIRTNDRTLAFYPNLELPSTNHYGEGIQGKVKIVLNDYSAGKGDNAKFCSFNLDIRDVYFLYEKAKMSHMTVPYTLTKIVGARVEPSGRFAGLSPVSRLSITRTAQASDGSPMRMPWKISIINGFAKAGKGRVAGTYFETKGTFVMDKESSMALTDADFLDIFTKISNYIKTYEMLVYVPLFKNGFNAYTAAEAERKARGSYSGTAQPSAPVETESVAEEAPAEIPETPAEESKQMTMDEVNTSTSAPVAPQPEAPNTHKMTMVISSPFQYLNGNSAVAQCMIGGKAYAVNFPEVDDALIEAQEKQLAISCLLYADKNNNMFFYSMAA